MKRSVYFKPPPAEEVGPTGYELIQVPCGKCIGCKLERSRQWAVRCVHEAQLHEHNCFLTLTYDNDHLPGDGSLQPRDMTLFLKRLRKAIAPEKVRYLQCGEYGEKFERPHHHVILFGYNFPDKQEYKVVRGSRLFISPLLADLWPFGFHTIGSVTFESAAYVARYILKKWKDKDYGGRHPEYITMSRRPGIAAGWLEKYVDDVYPSDKVVIGNGRNDCRPPRYYDKLYAANHGEEALEICRRRRRERAQTPEAQENSTSERLSVREKLAQLRACQLLREYEASASDPTP